ncbi:type VI secretion system-associated protein TagF [Chelativorans sp. AA-79]|uniref:type VI secretion system-associated protein TagF n=1 Tax=Chelativorans sp. AA-79 TaxID=3028735 RepID=UPI0023F87053|nr:type VI secretion system-associated protein TagF [Chelativorans sp. AA-79]WEX10855.1 type VI secretion system-associated protein TagF [Chelativorans sp. AA-79]
MGFGLFGKLPQKRDFISFGIPHEVLHPLETWLQSAVAASRAELGSRWEELYLVAPIWRFWVGPGILGASCAGALMPSVDGIGRYFPLMALYVAEPGRQTPPPPFAPQGDWYAALESRLLATLGETAGIRPETLLSDLPEPSTESAEPADGLALFKGGPVWRGKANAGVAALLASIVEADYREAARVRSYWWTAGTSEAGPMLHAREGLPDPYFYTLMLRVVAE